MIRRDCRVLNIHWLSPASSPTEKPLYNRSPVQILSGSVHDSKMTLQVMIMESNAATLGEVSTGVDSDLRVTNIPILLRPLFFVLNVIPKVKFPLQEWSLLRKAPSLPLLHQTASDSEFWYERMIFEALSPRRDMVRELTSLQSSGQVFQTVLVQNFRRQPQHCQGILLVRAS
ncbi:hypothetical protein AXG93_2175s1420 [Marchantia polymorpha subsp. ruderalis]|uniref:Uncharacterized protein n=1 Tax=Marchantia polymorpha subsp. ruderalis TaxID=1480154 RepID=A0A176W6A9_MARPO|nr:hypothetical protein AXG93_2175s1420 [Marchantia polymorpha subsp. ruderalis]